MIDVSVIIVNFNTKALLRDCLASVQTGCADLSVETFVIDNASSDGSVEMVRREFPSVRLQPYACNVGFAAANNLALKQAGGQWVVHPGPRGGYRQGVAFGTRRLLGPPSHRRRPRHLDHDLISR